MFSLTSIGSVPDLFEMDTITNRQLCSSIESFVAMKMQGPWGAIEQKGNKSNAKGMIAKWLIVTKKTMFN